ncbi:aminotransferase [Streptococcus henryi]|uniref:aminotransferase n=1 Tax=Streptococcus henryi TaxID=439219 RepID=UPI000375CBE5|nr:aminotransferase [Streptococcus henryi]
MYLPRFGVEEWLNAHENDALYDIAGVSISSLTLGELLKLAGKAPDDFYNELAEKTLDYGWIEGSPDFKRAVSELYRDIPEQQILQTNGATGANLLVMYALISSGDHVISHYPSYQQLYDIPKSLGAEVDLWEISEEEDWLPNLDKLRQLVGPTTKMICINNANNPTGAVMDEAYLRELVEIAKSCDAYILADEIYHTFDGRTIPAIADLYEKGISVNSLSKTYSLPGIRVGWVASNPQVTQLLKDYRDYTLICAGVFDDMVATLALQHREQILARNSEIVTNNLGILDTWIANEPKASFVKPAFVSTSFVKLDIAEPIEDFCLDLLKDYGVLVVPGNRFDFEGYVRIGYCCQEEVLREGLERLSQKLHESS